MAFPLLMSHNFAVASHAPETKTFWLGPRDRLNEPKGHYVSTHLLRGPRVHLPHHVPSVVAELRYSDTGFNIPEHAGHIATGSDDLAVAEEATATEITGVSREFLGTLHLARGTAFFLSKVVDGADVVQTTACDEVARRSVSAGHDPT